MELLDTALTSLLSIVVLFLLTKIMGNKQLSQLSMFDYITARRRSSSEWPTLRKRRSVSIRSRLKNKAPTPLSEHDAVRRHIIFREGNMP